MKSTTCQSGRRKLHFQTLDDVLKEAERLASVSTCRLGRWSLGQMLSHLALVYEKSIDGTNYRPGWMVRLMAKVIGPIIKRRVLQNGLPRGIRPPAFIFREVAPPAEVSTADGLQAIRRAISRLKCETHRDFDQCMGLFNREEWDQFHMRHAELHLSFIVPETPPP